MGNTKVALFFTFAALLFWFIGPIIVRFQLMFHNKYNPKLVEKSPKIFKGMKIFFRAFSIICIIFAFIVFFGIK